MRMKDLESVARQAMIDRGLLPDFSPAALAELNAITRPATASGASIRDQRQLLWASIDNNDSRDLDQLSVAEALPGDAYKILVAVADVDSTVPMGSALDDHARANTTSVYTAAKIFPMLPERLSTDLTSLGQDQDRLAHVVEFTVAPDGSLTGSDIYRSLVRNRAKLAYNSVGAWLNGTAPAPPALGAVAGVDQQLRIQDVVALNQFLSSRQKADPVRFPDLSLSVVKLLGRGEYQVELPGQPSPGHFGLAVSDYTHSTAPNRRFPDLITQRLVKAALAGTAPEYSTADLKVLAAHCTEQENNAQKVERQVQKSAAAFLLSSRIGQQFDSMVTGASNKGTWVRISSPVAEGRLTQGAEGLKVGDRVRVQLVHTDTARGFIDFSRVR